MLLGAASHDSTPAYGPVVAALRSHLRAEPDAFEDCGPLGAHLAAAAAGARPRARRGRRADPARGRPLRAVAVARERGALLVLDDLQWSDAATLELLAELGAHARRHPLLLVGAYRSDELAREHPLRRLRSDLRRRRALDEIALEPLDEAGTAALLAELLGERALAAAGARRPRPRPGAAVLRRGAGRRARRRGPLQPGAAGLELAEGSEVAVPETVRDAVLLRYGDLSAAGRAAAEAAAVAGERFELEAGAGLAGEDGVGELLEIGLIRESGDGRAAFRHALVREALYRDVPWLRRRELHRELGERLEARGAPGVEVAPHWLGAHDEERARRQLLRAAGEFEAAHAYRDAAGMARHALELWPAGEEVEERLAALERHGAWAELAGELADAARSWREVSSLCGEATGRRSRAAQRRLGRICAMQGDRAGAIEALTAAADAFAASGDPAAAAGDRHRRLGLPPVRRSPRRLARAQPPRRRGGRAAERVDLQSRALAAEGVVLAKRGDFEPGMEMVKKALSLALDNNFTAEAVDAYQRLGTVFETAGDYANAARGADQRPRPLPADGNHEPEAGCVACMAYVLRELGEWPRAVELSRELIAAHEGDGVRTIADGVFGFIRGVRGELGPARRL